MATFLLPAAVLLSESASLLAPRAQGWRFDLPSAVIGFILGVLAALGVYLMRHRIAAARDTVRDGAIHVQQRVSTGVEDRYREQMIERAERSHLLHRYASLSELHVDRRLIVPHAMPAALQPAEGEQESDRWQEMRLHDVLHPSPVTIDVREAIRGHRRLAFLGPMGSGRSTLIAYLTQLYARRVAWRLTFPEPDEEDERDLIAARDRERERLPVQVALQLVDLDLAEQGGRHALVEPVSDYVASSLGVLIGLPSAQMVRGRIISGKCILFFDNLDMLDADTRRWALDWIDRLAGAYPENVYVVAGGDEGYGALWQIGFATLMLEGFDQREVGHFCERWEGMRGDLDVVRWRAEAEALQAAYEEELARARREGRPLPDEADYAHPEVPELPPHLLDIWPPGRRERVLPVDLALAGLLWREQNAVPAESLMRYVQAALLAFRRAGDELLTPPQWARVLATVAWSMQSGKSYEVDRAVFEQAVTDLLDETYEASAGLRQRVEGEEDEKPDFGPHGRSAIAALLGTGDLVLEAARGRLGFVHPTFRAYFAAQHAARTEASQVLLGHVSDPGWQDTLVFYAALANVAPLVMARLKGPDDLFRSNFFAAASYLAASPEVDERLQGGVLADLAQVFMDPLQPALLGRRAATAIAHSKDRGAIYLFGQAMQNEDAHLRRLGVWGLAQMDHERVLAGLQHALSDADRLVRIEALHALAARGGDPAIDGLVQGLQDEDELARRVAAELLAGIGGEGHELLREGARSDDMYIRRAAVFGLGAVREPWALKVVDAMRRQDDEWFVRSAATEVMNRLEGTSLSIAPGPPGIEGQVWLARWATGRGVTLDSPQSVQRALLQALRDGDPTVKTAAADALRASGDRDVVPALKAELKDENLLVREAAFAALCEIARRTGAHVPA